MTVADKLLQVNQVKQDIKVAIETKGVPMTNVAFTEYANKILDISGGGSGGGDFPTISYDEIEYFGWSYYMFSQSNVIEQIPQAWQDMKDSETVLFDIPLALAAPNQEMGGMTIDIYVGTNGQLQALYDACVNETIPLPSSGNLGDIYLINNVAVKYYGDISDDVGFLIPLFEFGSMDDANGFIIGDLTPLGMGLGLVLAKFVNVSIPNNNIIIQQGFEFENESGIIIPNSITSIGYDAFRDWTSNNQPLVMPDSVTSIGCQAFGNWTSNNQPLVIPDSVTSIGELAFVNWTLVPYVEMKRTTPPTLGSDNAFIVQNNAPIYVPDESVEAYKTATNWVLLASRIFSINDK